MRALEMEAGLKLQTSCVAQSIDIYQKEEFPAAEKNVQYNRM